MSYQENILGFTPPDASSLLANPAPSAAKAGPSRHEALVQRLTARPGKPRLTPQEMVSLLFRQRARARIAALPRVSVSVSVFTPSGRPAVQISL